MMTYLKSGFLLILFFAAFSIFGQELVSINKTGSRTRAQIAAQTGLPNIRYGCDFYKVRYTSQDAVGRRDTLSGLLAIPNDNKWAYPLLVYQHGTSDCKTCVPSRFGTAGGEEGELGLLFSGLGFISFLPDYVGMGDGRGFQTYVHYKSTVQATEDMLQACEKWMSNNNIFFHDQLFITGYSQGGYASMAYQKYVEENNLRSVTAAAHLSGPYNLSGVMKDLIIGDKEYNYVAYLPNTFLGFNEAEKIFDNLEDVFRPEYIPDIISYYEGRLSLTQLNIRLIQKLVVNTGKRITKGMLNPSIIDSLNNSPNHILNRILRENDVHNWTPKEPTRIFYCSADDQVPFMNSIVAFDTMKLNGAIDLELRDVSPASNHGQCVNPALTAALIFFLSKQQLISSSNDVAENTPIRLFPNPSQSNVTIDFDNTVIQSVTILNVLGKSFYNISLLEQNQVYLETTSWPRGMYVVLASAPNGSTYTTKLILE